MRNSLAREQTITNSLFTPFRIHGDKMHSLDPYDGSDGRAGTVPTFPNDPVFNRGYVPMFSRNATQDDIWFALAEYVPAVSSPVGGNSIGNDVTENIDMNDDSNNGVLRPNGWGRSHKVYLDKWFHSDMKDMAYFYVYPLYDELKTKGNLK